MSYRYCCNHDVLCGTYDCNMADVVNNSVMCESKECIHNGGDYAKKHFIGMSEEELRYIHSDIENVAEYVEKKIKEYGSISEIPDDKFPF